MSIRIPITISTIAAFAVITISAFAPIVGATPEDEDAFPSLSPTLGVVELAGLEPEPEDDEISVQSKILAIMVKCTAIPSILGSAFIVFEVLRDKRKRGKSYHRLLLAMSISDILSSSAIFVGSWAIPKDTEGVYLAYGTETTCKIQGFFIQLGIVTPLYNGMLALYYFFSINWGWKEYQIHSIEKYLHAVPLAWGFSTAIACALLDIYGNATLWCWLGNSSDITNVLRYALYYGPVIVMLLMTTAIMISIYRFVREREKVVEKYDFRRSIEKSNRMSFSSEKPNRRSSDLFRGSITQMTIQTIVNGVNFNASDTGSIRRESISSQTSKEGDGIRQSENGLGNLSNEVSDCDLESHYGDSSDIELEDDDDDDDDDDDNDDDDDDASIDEDEHDDGNSNDNMNVKSINTIKTINIKNGSMEFEGIKSERNLPCTINEDKSNHFDEDFITDKDRVDDDTKDVRDKSGEWGSQELKTSETTNRRFHGRVAALFSRSTSDSDRDRSDDKSADDRSDDRSCQGSVDEFGVKTTRTMRQVARKTKHSKRVMIQSLWYIIAFYVSFIFACTARIYGTVAGEAPFPLLLLFSIFFPLQGFFNFLVYMRSRLRRLFKKSPNTSPAASRARGYSGSNASRKHDTESTTFSRILTPRTPTPNP